jgi:hypothetical protein
LGELLRLPLPSWQDDDRTAYALKGSEQATSISGPTDRRAADVPLQQRNVPEPPVEALDAGWYGVQAGRLREIAHEVEGLVGRLVEIKEVDLPDLAAVRVAILDRAEELDKRAARLWA